LTWPTGESLFRIGEVCHGLFVILAIAEAGRLLLALGTSPAMIQLRSGQGRPISVELLEGGQHECAAAGFPPIGDAGDCGGNARIGANGGARGYAEC